MAHHHWPDQAMLHAIVERATDGIFVADVDGVCTYVNEAGYRLIGYTREDILGESIADMIPVQDMDRLLRAGSALLKGRRDDAGWTLRRKDGTWVPVEADVSMLPGGQCRMSVRDISERKAHEAERKALLERIDTERLWRQAVMDTMPIGMALFQPGGLAAANHRMEELLGMKLPPGIGRAQYGDRIFYPDGRPVPPERLLTSRVNRGETVIGEEFLTRWPDGTQFPVLASAAPIADGEGRIIGGVGVYQDLSERMRLEQAVEENARLLKGVFDILPVGVWIADKSGRIVSNNPAAERIWRGARHVGLEEFGQYKGWWVDTGKPIAGEEWSLARAFTRGETSIGELVRIQCFDGSFKTIINSAAPLRDENGAITGAIVVNDDITALYQTQEQLRAAVRDREDILAVVTHDLRNPLSALRLVASTVERKSRALPGGEPVRAMAASIIDITRGMSALVGDLLAIAVARPGRSMLKIAPVDSGALLAKALESAQPMFAREGVEFEIMQAGELPVIQADADRILRVFSNLLDNALKFTQAPGKVVLRAEALSAGVRFCVANSGPALSAKELESMFQPFWQAGREDRRGAGLGLSICRSIVDAHGGSIWAEAATGKRVRICFLLPCVNPGAAASGALAVSQTGPG
ncbi:MAG TPA: PAS domain S-box protein [Ramlibacter sp.]|nr:PAS domain S-box protein [Ramlibacter sp.]